jgi:hypothetical protein
MITKNHSTKRVSDVILLLRVFKYVCVVDAPAGITTFSGRNQLPQKAVGRKVQDFSDPK